MTPHLCILLLFGLLLVSCFAQETKVVVPNSLVTTEGDSNNAFPFNIAAASPPAASMRYQQVYSASQFSGIMSMSRITRIAFRPDGSSLGTAFSSTLPNIEISLSMTARAPGGLENTFANNIGDDPVVVFGPGPLALSSDASGSPHDFDIIIELDLPYEYDPADGNLLLDVKNFGGGSTTYFDADSSGADTSRVYSTDVNATTANGGANNNGLVTQFTFEPIPSPRKSQKRVRALVSIPRQRKSIE